MTNRRKVHCKVRTWTNKSLDWTEADTPREVWPSTACETTKGASLWWSNRLTPLTPVKHLTLRMLHLSSTNLCSRINRSSSREPITVELRLKTSSLLLCLTLLEVIKTKDFSKERAIHLALSITLAALKIIIIIALMIRSVKLMRWCRLCLTCSIHLSNTEGARQR